MQFTIFSVATAIAIFGQGSLALWDCNEDQNAFPFNSDNFVAHYTSIRDTATGRPWVRVCIPGNNGKWESSEVLETDCSTSYTTFSEGKTGLSHALSVWDGNGCNEDSSNLEGAMIKYNGEEVDLMNPGGACGKRDHGISCEFPIA